MGISLFDYITLFTSGLWHCESLQHFNTQSKKDHKQFYRKFKKYSNRRLEICKYDNKCELLMIVAALLVVKEEIQISHIRFSYSKSMELLM